jgi:hypothetical protein
MDLNTATADSRLGRRIGVGLTAFVALFLVFDAVIHLLKLHAAVTAFADLGYPARLTRGIGVLELICVLLYLAPRTSILGAVLLTGYLGGAVSAHLRVEDPLLSTTLFPVYLGVLLWLGLWLRNAALRALATA